jgi:hypothetical protein
MVAILTRPASQKVTFKHPIAELGKCQVCGWLNGKVLIAIYGEKDDVAEAQYELSRHRNATVCAAHRGALKPEWIMKPKDSPTSPLSLR